MLVYQRVSWDEDEHPRGAKMVIPFVLIRQERGWVEVKGKGALRTRGARGPNFEKANE